MFTEQSHLSQSSKIFKHFAPFSITSLCIDIVDIIIRNTPSSSKKNGRNENISTKLFKLLRRVLTGLLRLDCIEHP